MRIFRIRLSNKILCQRHILRIPKFWLSRICSSWTILPLQDVHQRNLATSVASNNFVRKNISPELRIKWFIINMHNYLTRPLMILDCGDNIDLYNYGMNICIWITCACAFSVHRCGRSIKLFLHVWQKSRQHLRGFGFLPLLTSGLADPYSWPGLCAALSHCLTDASCLMHHSCASHSARSRLSQTRCILSCLCVRLGTWWERIPPPRIGQHRSNRTHRHPQSIAISIC